MWANVEKGQFAREYFSAKRNLTRRQFLSKPWTGGSTDEQSQGKHLLQSAHLWVNNAYGPCSVMLKCLPKNTHMYCVIVLFYTLHFVFQQKYAIHTGKTLAKRRPSLFFSPKKVKIWSIIIMITKAAAQLLGLRLNRTHFYEITCNPGRTQSIMYGGA